MSDIIDLEAFRQQHGEGGWDGLACSCGEAWFSLGERGAVCMTQAGEITGWAGTLRCVSCGKPA